MARDKGLTPLCNSLTPQAYLRDAKLLCKCHTGEVLCRTRSCAQSLFMCPPRKSGVGQGWRGKEHHWARKLPVVFSRQRKKKKGEKEKTCLLRADPHLVLIVEALE